MTDVEVCEIGTTLVDLFDHLQEMDVKDKQMEEANDIGKNENEKIELHKTI